MECFLALCLSGKYINPCTNQTHPLPDSSLGLIIDTYMYIEKNWFPVPSPFCGIMCFGRLMRLMRSAIISGGGGGGLLHTFCDGGVWAEPSRHPLFI